MRKDSAWLEAMPERAHARVAVSKTSVPAQKKWHGQHVHKDERGLERLACRVREGVNDALFVFTPARAR